MKPVKFLVTAALAFALVGCSNSAEPVPDPVGDDSDTADVDTPDQELAAEAGGEITVTDMVGREVTLPEPARNPFGAGPPATALLYTFDAETLAGWNSPVSEAQAHFLDGAAQELPVLGRAFGKGGDFNPETLLSADVDLIVDAGDLNPSYIESANDLEELTGIPVLQLSTNPDDLAEAYDILGAVLGDPERGEELGEKTDRIVADVAAGADAIDAPLSVFYAQGASGLNTAPSGSIHSRVIELIGATNAAEGVESPSGRVEVDFEQVLLWEPDVVILGPDSPEDDLAKDPAADESFGALSAVQEGRVYVAPAQPFGWFDRPPSVNQLIGMMWAAQAVYPDAYDFDLVAETQDFYGDFYHYDLTDEKASEILQTSGVTP